ncbi:MAG: XdhC family protein, partial [Bacteroidota bacterium]
MKEIRQIIQLYDQLKAQNVASALAIVVDVEASSYRRIGARLLVAEDGRYVGGISGGCLEGDALRRARAAILAAAPATHTYDTMDGEDAVIGIGLGCEGRIDVLFVPLNYQDANNEVEALRTLIHIRKKVVMARLLKRQPHDPLEPGLYPIDNLRLLSAVTG